MNNVDNSKNEFIDNYFSNVKFSITIAYTNFKFSLQSSYPFGGNRVSDCFYIGPSFYFMAKIGERFINFVNIIFCHIKQKLRPKYKI